MEERSPAGCPGPAGDPDRNAPMIGKLRFWLPTCMSIISVLGAVGGLHVLFLVALLVTKRYDLQARPSVFAAPPTHVRVLRDDPHDPRRTAADEHMTFLVGG